MSVVVAAVEGGSIAGELGIQPGDRIICVNSQPMRDSLDFLQADSLSELLLEWSEPDGTTQAAEIEKDEDEPLGITLRADPVRTCVNKCMFCFVDQMPRHLRNTLYLKDDDWRTSFLHGSYVTLTNLDEADVRRIIEEKASPLFVSVHASDPEVRSRLLGIPKAQASLAILERLARNGISMHTQAVICPGVNDGAVLEDTVRALQQLYPSVLSLSVVPVGLTSFRDGLEKVRTVTADEADAILDTVTALQEEFLKDTGTRFVFAADELYLKAGRSFPAPDAYEGFPQLENGVGLVADFLVEAGDALRRLGPGPPDIKEQRRIGSVTGVSFAPILQEFRGKVHERTGVRWEVTGVPNHFFGEEVTVTGLLTGGDISAALSEKDWDMAFVPEIVFRDTGETTLDGMTIEDIERLSGMHCIRASSDVALFMDQLHQAAGGDESWQSPS